MKSNGNKLAAVLMGVGLVAFTWSSLGLADKEDRIKRKEEREERKEEKEKKDDHTGGGFKIPERHDPFRPVSVRPSFEHRTNSGLLLAREKDINGDGIPDDCRRVKKGILCKVSRINNYHPLRIDWSEPYIASASVPDFPGIGEFSDAAGWNDPSLGETLTFVDINNDGFADVCGRAHDGIVCALSDGRGRFEPLKSIQSHLPKDKRLFHDLGDWNKQGPQANLWKTIKFGDIDGDGRIDVCGKAYVEGMVCLGNNTAPTSDRVSFGSNFEKWSSIFEPTGTYLFGKNSGWENSSISETIQLIDIDNDGYADVCAKAFDNAICALSEAKEGRRRFGQLKKITYQGQSIFSIQEGWKGANVNKTIQYVDLQGDGRFEMCGQGNFIGCYTGISVGEDGQLKAAGFRAMSKTPLLPNGVDFDYQPGYPEEARIERLPAKITVRTNPNRYYYSRRGGMFEQN